MRKLGPFFISPYCSPGINLFHTRFTSLSCKTKEKTGEKLKKMRGTAAKKKRVIKQGQKRRIISAFN